MNTSQTYFIRTIQSAFTNCIQVSVNMYFIQWTTVVSLFMQLYDLLLSHWHLRISCSDPEFDLRSGCGLCFEANIWPTTRPWTQVFHRQWSSGLCVRSLWSPVPCNCAVLLDKCFTNALKQAMTISLSHCMH